MFVSYTSRLDDFAFDYEDWFRVEYTKVYPCGWAFFTKSPKGPNAKLFSVNNKNQFELISYANASIYNFFGLSRKSRRIGYEISVFANQIKKSEWTQIEGVSIPSISKISEKSFFNENIDVKHFPEGRYLLCLETPIPFAWRNDFSVKNNQMKYIVINLKHCF